MNKNDASESTTSLGLSGLNVVIEDETEYDLIADFNLDEWDGDDDDWTNCDMSPSLSCATSVATNVTLKDLNLIEDSAMLDLEDDDAMDIDGVVGSKCENGGAGSGTNFRIVNPKNGRRLSNKKLRKKLKMMKKAAAARAAAEALASQKAEADAAILASSLESTDTAMSDLVVASSAISDRGTKSPKRKSHSGSIAVACAHEALDTYRGEIEAGRRAQRKMRTVSIDIQG